MEISLKEYKKRSNDYYNKAGMQFLIIAAVALAVLLIF